MAQKPRVLISACLLGEPCRYDGKSQPVAGIEALLEDCEAIPVCPEQLGGLPTPRCPAERHCGRVVNRAGEDVTDAFERGASAALELARRYDARLALLKSRSPSCGSREVYDGRFTGILIPGKGVTAEALTCAGIAVYDENQLDAFIKALKGTDDDSLQQ